MALTAIALGTALATGPTATALALAELHATGARILLDDFGTGFSSLSYLQRLPLDGLKIDRSFVQHVTTSPRVRTLVAAMLAMAEGLDSSSWPRALRPRRSPTCWPTSAAARRRATCGPSRPGRVSSPAP